VDHAPHPGRTGPRDVHGKRLFTYLQQFEKDFCQSKRRIIDATEGGAVQSAAARR
jgi:hypothetical protein